MPDSPSAWLRSLAAEATPGPWARGSVWLTAGVQRDDTCAFCTNYGDPVVRERMDINGTMMMAHIHRNPDPYAIDHEISGPPGVVVAGNYDYETGGILRAEDARLIALAPDLAVLCADAIDALEYVLGYDVAGWDAHMDSPHLLNPKLRDLLARFAALQPDNTEEAASEDPTAGLPADLVSALRDPSVIVPQDAALFELIAKWANAPSDTASAETPEGEGR